MRQHPQRGRTHGASLRNALMGVLVLFLLLCGMVPAAADEYYDIRDYDVHMVVGRDNRYDIAETITAHFKTPRHGIYRTIPTEQYGYRHKISNIEVLNPDTGAKHPYSMSRDGSLVTLRIGDADVYVEVMSAISSATPMMQGTTGTRSMTRCTTTSSAPSGTP
jgi:hypothetical protein